MLTEKPATTCQNDERLLSNGGRKGNGGHAPVMESEVCVFMRLLKMRRFTENVRTPDSFKGLRVMASGDRRVLSGDSQGSGLGDVLTKTEGPSADDLEASWALPGNIAPSTSWGTPKRSSPQQIS